MHGLELTTMFNPFHIPAQAVAVFYNSQTPFFLSNIKVNRTTFDIRFDHELGGHHKMTIKYRGQTAEEFLLIILCLGEIELHNSINCQLERCAVVNLAGGLYIHGEERVAVPESNLLASINSRKRYSPAVDWTCKYKTTTTFLCFLFV